jgi:hypothetical protein
MQNGADQLRQSRKNRLAALASASQKTLRRATEEAANENKPFAAGDKEDGLHAVPDDIASDVGKPIGVDLGTQLTPVTSAYARLRQKLRAQAGLTRRATEQAADENPFPPKKATEYGDANPFPSKKSADDPEKLEGTESADANPFPPKKATEYGDALPYQAPKAAASRRRRLATEQAMDSMPPMTSGEEDVLNEHADAETDELVKAMEDAMAEAQQAQNTYGGEEGPEHEMKETPAEETKEHAGGDFPPPPVTATEQGALPDDLQQAEEYSGAEGDGVPPPAVRDEKKDAEWMEMMSEDDLGGEEKKASFALQLHLANADSEDPHYVLLANGHAFGEIHFKDQPGPLSAEYKQMFVDAATYADTMDQCVRKFGLRETMKRSFGKFYAARVSKSALAKKIRAEVTAEITEKNREKLATVKDRFADWFSVALEAFNKGILTRGEGHPVKEEMVKQLAAAKIHPQRAIDMIEAAFRAGGRRFSSNVAARAAEWMAAPAEHQAAIVREVRGADHHVPVIASSEEIVDENVRNLAMGSVPITSLGVNTPRGQAERYASIDPEMAEAAARGKAVVKALRRR